MPHDGNGDRKLDTPSVISPAGHETGTDNGKVAVRVKRSPQ
mgnify:CR=1 FL=1